MYAYEQVENINNTSRSAFPPVLDGGLWSQRTLIIPSYIVTAESNRQVAPLQLLLLHVVVGEGKDWKKNVRAGQS